MRRHAAGVCIVSVGTGEAVNGMAVTAATSFSMEPPSMLVCINETASIADDLREGVAFALTLLGCGHETVATAFSTKPIGRPRFDHGRWRLTEGALHGSRTPPPTWLARPFAPSPMAPTEL